jgi:hypothetical protein
MFSDIASFFLVPFGNIYEVQIFENLVHEKTSNRSTIGDGTNDIHNKTYPEVCEKEKSC